MANPFGKMKIERDSDDEDDDFQKVKSNKPSQQLFVSQEPKKNRPENKENQSSKIEEQEGFEEVSKHKPQRKKQKDEEDEDFN